MHIPMNEADERVVAVRPMVREDLDAYANWGRHSDPIYAGYNVPPLDANAARALWRHLAGHPRERRPYAGLVDGRFAAQLMLRFRTDPQLGDIGIAVDPALIGRGVGTRILQSFAAYLRHEHDLRRLTLDVATYNERAIRAYRAAGFTPLGERFGEPEPGLGGDVLLALGEHARFEGGRWRVRILHMEMKLDAETFVTSNHA